MQSQGHTGQPAPRPAPPPPVMQPESGNAVTNAVADVVNKTAAPFQNLSNPNIGVFEKAQGVVGAVASAASAPADFANNAIARATNGISKALPSFPAATLGSLVIGIPHLHAKPPALPFPLPGIGMVITSCPTVLIGGMPAARSGDYGLGPTCGSLFPIFEIFTGSSKVFIGGSRAARAIDFTRQCMPAPKGPGGAAKAMGSMTKMQKAMGAAGKVMGAVGAASMVMGAYGVGKHEDDSEKNAEAAQEAADAAMASQEASEAEIVDAQATAAAAAAEAAGAALAASMMGADLAMNALQMAMGMLMGKDPGAPPCIGMVSLGVNNVLIGGFPMPSWSDLAKGMKKLIGMVKRGRRGGKAAGKAFCFGCM